MSERSKADCTGLQFFEKKIKSVKCIIIGTKRECNPFTSNLQLSHHETNITKRSP